MIYDLVNPNLFSLLRHYKFRRMAYESQDCFAVEKDGKVYIYINALGIDKKDLDIKKSTDDYNKPVVTINCKTTDEITGGTRTLDWERSFNKEIESFDVEFKNGYLVLEVGFKTPVEPSFKINVK